MVKTGVLESNRDFGGIGLFDRDITDKQLGCYQVLKSGDPVIKNGPGRQGCIAIGFYPISRYVNTVQTGTRDFTGIKRKIRE